MRHLGNRFLGLIKREITGTISLEDQPYVGHYTLPTQLYGRPYTMPFVWFATRCRFDRAGACIQCNFGRSRPDSKFILERLGTYLNQFRGLPLLYITPAGSMFDDNEVPEALRLQIFDLIRSLGFTVVCTETRAEYLTEKKLQQVRDVLGNDISMEIGFGLESIDPWILRNCINKMLDPQCIAEAITLCHNQRVETYLHILTNPPFLTEYEAIKDAHATAQWAFANSTDRVGFALMNVKPATVTHWLWERHMYSIPTLWTVMQVLLNLSPEQREHAHLFGMNSAVPINAYSTTCPHCTNHVRSLLDSWCYTHDDNLLYTAAQFPCLCRQSWLESLEAPRHPLPERVGFIYRRLGCDILGIPWWKENEEWVLADLNRSIETE